MTNNFDALFKDLDSENDFSIKKPFLAHYSSIANIENIISSKEIWLSNPLLMNDIEELRYGLVEAKDRFYNNNAIKKTCKNNDEYQKLLEIFNQNFDAFESNNAIDTYVFCLSNYNEEKNKDGLLSMWRGYGADGSGAAIIFDTSKIDANESSPFVFRKVDYLTREERIVKIDQKFDEFSDILKNNAFSDKELHEGVFYLFDRILLLSLFTKHRGFAEEQEWRIVYIKHRDIQNTYEKYCGYEIKNQKHIEPKLKLPIKPLTEYDSKDFSLEKIIDKIILGPSISQEMTLLVVKRMLEQHKMTQLRNRVFFSDIPYRPI